MILSLALYDKALYDKIYNLFPNVINANEDDALKEGYRPQVEVQEGKGETDKVDTSRSKASEVAFPLISFWRTDNPPGLSGYNEGNFAEMLRGRREMVSNINGFKIRTFPIKISYQVSIWSDKRVEVDEIYQEFLMLFFVDEPYLTVKVVDADFNNEETNDQDKVILTEDFALKLEDSSSNIDTTSFSDKGRLYRQDILIEIDNAKLFYLGGKSKIAKYIPLTVDLLDPKNKS